MKHITCDGCGKIEPYEVDKANEIKRTAFCEYDKKGDASVIRVRDFCEQCRDRVTAEIEKTNFQYPLHTVVTTD